MWGYNIPPTSILSGYKTGKCTEYAIKRPTLYNIYSFELHCILYLTHFHQQDERQQQRRCRCSVWERKSIRRVTESTVFTRVMLVILVIYCLLFSIKWCGMSTSQTLIIHSLKTSLTFICLVSLCSYNSMSEILPFFIPQIRSIDLIRLRPPMYIHVCEKYPNSSTCTLNMLHKRINIYRRHRTIIFFKWVLATDDNLLATVKSRI